MLTGENPFFWEGINQMDLFRSIVDDPYAPPVGVSAEGRNLISGLLTKDPVLRLGSLARGESDILQHAWFGEELSLYQMRRRQIPAPWVPSVKDPLDASCFDDWTDQVDKTTEKFPELLPEDAKLFEGF